LRRRISASDHIARRSEPAGRSFRRSRRMMRCTVRRGRPCVAPRPASVSRSTTAAPGMRCG